MRRPDDDWATILDYENTKGCLQPAAAMRAWLRDRGIDDWMPFDESEIRVSLACGIDDGHWRGRHIVQVRADALRRLGLHPDQPTSDVRD